MFSVALGRTPVMGGSVFLGLISDVRGGADGRRIGEPVATEA